MTGGAPLRMGESGMFETLQQTAGAIQSTQDIALSSIPEAERAHRIPGYVLAQCLGTGGFAEVWRGVQVRTGKQVAVKVFRRKKGVNWFMLRKEVEQLIRLDRHPNIVSLLDADLASDTPYYVTDLMDGGSLERALAEPAAPPADRIAEWLAQIADALAFVHAKGIIHCDLKPANVLLDSEGRSRVADFGQARTNNDDTGALGTMLYMAPEQAFPAGHPQYGHPDVRWDVYGLGATGYALLSGAAPFRGQLTARLKELDRLDERLAAYRVHVATHPLKFAPNLKVDAELAAIIERCTDPDPAKRYPTIQAVRDDLRARAEGRVVSVLAANPRYRLRKFMRRNMLPLAIGALALAGLAWGAGRLASSQQARTRQLAWIYKLRGWQSSERGDPAGAAAFFAESNALLPSRSARLNAAIHVAQIAPPLATLLHGAPVTGIRFSADGRLVASLGADGTVRLWDPVTRAQIWSATRHGAAVTDGAFSPDGARFATASEDGTAIVWDTLKGTPAFAALRQRGGIVALGWSPDARRLVTGGRDRSAWLWNAATGDSMMQLSHGGEVTAVAFSPDGSRIATAGEDARVKMWSGRTGESLGESDDTKLGTVRDVRLGLPHAAPVDGLAFSPDGKALVTGCRDGTIRSWDPRRSAALSGSVGLDWPVKAIVASPQGDLVAVATSGREISLWSLPGLTRAGRDIRPGGNILSMRFDPESRWLLVGGDQGTARLWDVATRRPVGRALSLEGPVSTLAFSPDGRIIAAAGPDGAVRLWEASAVLGSAGTVKIAEAPVALRFTADGGRLITADPTGGARGWNAATLRPEGDPLRHDAPLLAVASGPAGGAVAFAATGRVLGAATAAGTEPPGGWFDRAEFSVSGKWVLASGYSTPLTLFDAATGQAVRTPKTALPTAPGLLWFESGDESGVAVTRDGVVSVFPLGAKGGEPRVMKGSPYTVAAAHAATARLLAVADSTGGVRWWDLAKAAPAGPAIVHPGVRHVSIADDGKLALTAGSAGPVRLWDPRNGAAGIDPIEIAVGIEAAFLVPNGRVVVVACTDGQVLAFESGSGEPLGTPVIVPGRPVRAAASPDSLRLAIATADGGIHLFALGEHVAPAMMSAGDLSQSGRAAVHRRINEHGVAVPVPPAEYLDGGS